MKSLFDGFGTDFDTISNKRNDSMTPLAASKKHRPLRAGIGLLLAVGLALGNLIPLSAAQAAAPASNAAWPIRNFLPPIASINPKLMEKQATQTGGDLDPVALSAVSSPVIHTSPRVSRLATDIDVSSKNEKTQALMAMQKKVDEADLEHLWQATVEKNPVIRFSLEKLAAPPDLQTKQSSKFLSRTLSMLISGATMGATMLPGASAYQNMGAMSVGNALQNIVSGNAKPTPNALSATEQIQLAGLIDELKLKLIHNYQDYKNTLQALSEAREVTMKNNNLYSKALGSKNDLSVMAAGTAYYKALMQETELRQKAKLYRLQLERLAGTDAVASLELAPKVSMDSKASASDEASPQAELHTNANILPSLPSQPAKPASLQPTASNQPADTLPQAMEIGPSLSESMIGPPLPTLSSNMIKSKRAMVKNTPDKSDSLKAAVKDSQPQPIPDKIMEQPAIQPMPQPQQEKP